jgi:hypothetical protein
MQFFANIGKDGPFPGLPRVPGLPLALQPKVGKSFH